MKKTKIELIQNNIKIRNADKNDATLLGNWWRDGKIMAHAGFPNGINKTDEQIIEELANSTTNILIVEFDSIPIGEVNYQDKGDNICSIGIKICNFQKHRQGLGTISTSMLIDYLFKNKAFDKIILDTNLNNIQAQSFYEKLGFHKIGIRNNCWRNQLGELQSAVDYKLEKIDWR